MNGSALNNCNNGNGKVRFIPVPKPKFFIPILKERHPQSCFIYNQVMFSDNLKGHVNFYTLSNSKDATSDSWLIVDYTAEDYGHFYSISAPKEIVEGKEKIPQDIKDCFAYEALIDWDGGFMFVALEKPISAMIFDISANIEGNFTEVHPCILYYIEKEDVLKLSNEVPSGYELKSLDPTEDSNFIFTTWNYATENSKIVIPRILAATPSAGLFVDGKCVSGVMTQGYGMLACLYTLKEHRGGGKAKLTMEYAYKESIKHDYVPCSTAEIKNHRAIGFHESLGLKRSSIVDFIIVKKLNID